jgi:peroxiredoxin
MNLTPEMVTKLMSLATDLSTFKDHAQAQMPTEHSHAISQSIEDFVQTWNPASAINVGQPFPDFSPSDATGKQVSMKELLAKGPLLISFYRGAWCPYCNLALKALQDSLSAIKAKGVTLVAISPELPDQSPTMQEKSAIQFPVLSDVGNNLARKLGLLFQQPDTLRPILNAHGVDLQARNGDDSYEVPFPASYLIDSKGVIRSAFLDPDYTRRLEPSTALGWIDEMQHR